jgi:hypothetical protein
MTGTSNDLAQRLSNKTVDSMTVKVIGMSQNSVTVELSSVE